MKSDIENKEWLDEYPSLKQITLKNPFTVPEGYFGSLEERVISYVRVNEIAPPTSTPFAVPDNYFEKLSSNTLSRVNILEAANADAKGFRVPENYFEDMASQLNSRIAISEAVEHPFAVPENYFDDLHAQVTSRVAIEGVLNTPFTVLENYFDDLHAQVTSRIAIEEALNTPFTIPENYFDKLNRRVLNQTVVLEAVQRKGLVRKLISSAAFKYASAACFAMIVGAGIFITQLNSPKAAHNRSYLHKALSKVPNNDIRGYLQLHIDATDTKSIIDKADEDNVNAISSDDLKDYLSNN